MKTVFDPEKNRINIIKHDIDFNEVEHFDWDNAVIYKDKRKDYGEERRLAIGLIGQRVYILVYTIRKNSLRIISLRKANKREVKKYEKEIKKN